MDLLYISALWSTLYFTNSEKSLFHLKLLAWITCTEDVYFHRSVACSSTTGGVLSVFFLTIHFFLSDEQFRLEFWVRLSMVC